MVYVVPGAAVNSNADVCVVAKVTLLPRIPLSDKTFPVVSENIAISPAVEDPG